MSTMLQDKGDHFVVSTLASPGRRRHMPRGPVKVSKDDMRAVRAECVRQAEQARTYLNLHLPEGEPVD